nr:hypothetical protein [Tanacetum cinerariifolium]
MSPRNGLWKLDMDLLNLIRAPNPTKVKTGSHPRAPHEVPLLTLTATRVIEMDCWELNVRSIPTSSVVFPLPVMCSHCQKKFPLLEESSHCQKKFPLVVQNRSHC